MPIPQRTAEPKEKRSWDLEWPWRAELPCQPQPFSLELLWVLVCSGCYHKVPETGWLVNNKHFFHCSGGWKSKITVLADLVIGDSPHPVKSHGRRARECSWVSFISTLIPLWRALLSWPNNFPKAHLLIPSPCGVDFNIWIWGGHKYSGHSIWDREIKFCIVGSLC